jgi:hypothetical protein
VPTAFARRHRLAYDGAMLLEVPMRLVCFARVALVALVAGLPSAALAQQCNARAATLTRAADMAFNRYYFSLPDDTARCEHLRTALERRAELLALSESCGADEADVAAQLRKLEALRESDASCR